MAHRKDETKDKTGNTDPTSTYLVSRRLHHSKEKTYSEGGSSNSKYHPLSNVKQQHESGRLRKKYTHEAMTPRPQQMTREKRKNITSGFSTFPKKESKNCPEEYHVYLIHAK